MSLEPVQPYCSPRVEDVFSEAGDRPARAPQNSKRLRKPTPGASHLKVDTNRSASDSGYSSKTDHTADSVGNGAGARHESLYRPRTTPYQNTHQRRKESLDYGKKAKPTAMPIPNSGANRGTMAPPPLPPMYQAPANMPGVPLRTNAALSSGALSPLSMPPMPVPFQQPLTLTYTSASPNYSSAHAYSAPPSAVHGSHRPGPFSTQPGSTSYQPLSPTFAAPTSTSYNPSQGCAYPMHPPPSIPSFAMPAPLQRHQVFSRHTAPLVSHGQAQPHPTYAPDPSQLNFQALAITGPPLDRPADKVPFMDPRDGKIKCYRKGKLFLWEEDRPKQRLMLEDKKHRRHTRREQESNSESSYCSDSECSECQAESEEDHGRTSPRRILHRTQSSRSSQPSPRKPSRPTSFASSGNSRDDALEREKQKLSDVEEYQKELSTPPRRNADEPKYLEDTKRATKKTSSRRSSSPPRPSPARSSASESRSDSRRKSWRVSTRGPISVKPGEDGGYLFETPHGQEITMVISEGQMTASRYITSGSSQSGRQSERRPSTAPSNRTRGTSDARRASKDNGKRRASDARSAAYD